MTFRDELESVLRGRSALALAEAFAASMNYEVFGGTRGAAILFDTNALIRFATSDRHAPALDYLEHDHEGPVVVPNQALLEFWNNRMVDLSNQGDKLRASLRALSDQVSNLAADLGISEEDARARVDELSRDLPAGIDSTLRTVIDNSTQQLARFAVSSGEPRADWSDVAEARRRAKIPPGFKDAGSGDFYVWCDGLHAIADALDSGAALDHVIVVTQDVKKDWSTGGKPHPYLVAEVRAALGVSLHLWSTDDLLAFVERETAVETDEEALAAPEGDF